MCKGVKEKIKHDIKKYFTYTGNVFEKDVYEKFEKLINAKYDSDDSCNKTLIHGSCKLDNIMIHDSKPYFIDWSLFRQGYGVEDILFLLIFSLEHDVLKINYNIYMNYYLSKINEHIEYLPDKYKSDIKKSLEDFIGHCIVGLYIKDCFSKIKNQKINGYLKNFLYILSIYS